MGELIPAVGIEPSYLSQQLGILRRANILQVRKEGAVVRYSATDPRIFDFLEVARAILTTSLAGSGQLLAELQAQEAHERSGSPAGARAAERGGGSG